MMNSQQVAFRLRYGDVILTLLRFVLLVYNKLLEVTYIANNSFETMANLLNSLDDQIVEKFLKEICTDLNNTASRKTAL